MALTLPNLLLRIIGHFVDAKAQVAILGKGNKLHRPNRSSNSKTKLFREVMLEFSEGADMVM